MHALASTEGAIFWLALIFKNVNKTGHQVHNFIYHVLKDAVMPAVQLDWLARCCLPFNVVHHSITNVKQSYRDGVCNLLLFLL